MNGKSIWITPIILVSALILFGCSNEKQPLNDDNDLTESYEEEDNSSVNDYEKDEEKPVYTKEELEADPKAPSNNPDDYNEDGEFVPSGGPSSNPADYNSKGEFKPVEEMTQEEIEQELKEMLGR